MTWNEIWGGQRNGKTPHLLSVIRPLSGGGPVGFLNPDYGYFNTEQVCHDIITKGLNSVLSDFVQKLPILRRTVTYFLNVLQRDVLRIKNHHVE